jgi:predicted nucleotidyltransferase
MTRQDVLGQLVAHAGELQQMGVRWLGLFGSFARDEARPDSDVDLVVDLDRITFDRFMDLKLRLEDVLHRRVDLVLRDSLKPRIREQILRECIRAA